MSRNPRAMRHTVGPLDLEEAGALIASVIGRGSLGHATLRRWHEETAGNSYALMMMLIANERAGTLQQRPTGAYVAADDEVIPEEFVSYLDQHCTDAERLALEIVALAHPFSSSALVHRADPDALATLLERSLLRSTFSADGASELRIATPLLAATVLSRISPSRREALYREFFESLTAGVRDDEFLTSRSLVQVVDYGLRLDLPLSEAWLNAAVAKLSINGDPQLLLRVSLRLARDFESPDAAAAAIRSVSIAQQLGRPADAQLAFSSIERLLNHPQCLRELGPELRVRLHLTQLERQFHNDWPMAAILEQLDRLAGSIEPEYRVAHEIIHSMRFRLVMSDGSFDLLDESWIAQPPSPDFLIETVRSPARSLYGVLLMQRGQVSEGLRITAHARAMGLMGRRPLNDRFELTSFHWFLGYWASGDAAGARQALEDVQFEAEQSRHTGAGLSRIVEIAWALLALQQAQWGDALRRIEQLQEELPGADPFGTGPLLSAMQALALAATGQRIEAITALERSGEKRRGLATAIDGFRRRIRVQAQQWLRVGDPGAEALALAEWARQRRFDLIELQALHIAAIESTAHARAWLSRAQEISVGIDPLLAEVMLGHIEKIALGASPTDVSIPEVRLLAELGMWMPLPASTALSVREREISLLASLGYPSRFIAERLHLSTRTVETHLAHVYVKLSVADRTELREWFSADRRLAS